MCWNVDYKHSSFCLAEEMLVEERELINLVDPFYMQHVVAGIENTQNKENHPIQYGAMILYINKHH